MLPLEVRSVPSGLFTCVVSDATAGRALACILPLKEPINALTAGMQLLAMLEKPGEDELHMTDFHEHEQRVLAHLEHTLEIPLSPSTPHWTAEPAQAISRAMLETRFHDLADFVRAICEGDVPIGSGKLVSGQRAIELAAWALYRKLHHACEI